MGGNALWILVGVIALSLLWLIFYLIPIGYWFTLYVSGVKISLWRLISMRFRRAPVKAIIEGMIIAQKSEIDITTKDLEALHSAGGNTSNVIYAIATAKANGLALDFKTAAELSIAGKDVLAIVREKIGK